MSGVLVTAAFAATTCAVVGVIAELNRQIADLETKPVALVRAFYL